MHRGRDRFACGRRAASRRPAGEDIDHEGEVKGALPTAPIGQVPDPEPVRARSAEVAPHQVGAALSLGVGLCRAPGPPTALGTADPCLSHQPLHSTPADLHPLAPQGNPDPPVTVGAVVALVDLCDGGKQALIAQAPSRSLTLGALIVGGGRHLQGGADGLDPEALAMAIDERAHFGRCGSSSAAKKTEAALRISFARRSSRTSPRRRPSSSRSSLPNNSLRLPRSASAWRTHLRSVSAGMPNHGLRGRLGGRNQRPTGHRGPTTPLGTSSVVT